ncbi:RNA-dependent ATPase [Sorochytrium milnesiophthora]
MVTNGTPQHTNNSNTNPAATAATTTTTTGGSSIAAIFPTVSALPSAGAIGTLNKRSSCSSLHTLASIGDVEGSVSSSFGGGAGGGSSSRSSISSIDRGDPDLAGISYLFAGLTTADRNSPEARRLETVIGQWNDIPNRNARTARIHTIDDDEDDGDGAPVLGHATDSNELITNGTHDGGITAAAATIKPGEDATSEIKPPTNETTPLGWILSQPLASLSTTSLTLSATAADLDMSTARAVESSSVPHRASFSSLPSSYFQALAAHDSDTGQHKQDEAAQIAFAYQSSNSSSTQLALLSGSSDDHQRSTTASSSLQHGNGEGYDASTKQRAQTFDPASFGYDVSDRLYDLDWRLGDSTGTADYGGAGPSFHQAHRLPSPSFSHSYDGAPHHQRYSQHYYAQQQQQQQQQYQHQHQYQLQHHQEYPPLYAPLSSVRWSAPPSSRGYSVSLPTPAPAPLSLQTATAPPMTVQLSPGVCAQWLSSRIGPSASLYNHQMPTSVSILGGNPFELHIGYPALQKPSSTISSFVLLEQINLFRDVVELHIPSSTSVLNYLLSWTTVSAAHAFGVHRLTPMQAHILPLLARPLVNYSQKLINKEKMPHIIVGVGDNSCGKTWTYLLGCIDYIVRGYHFQRGEVRARRARVGPKAIILLPSKEAVLKVKKLLAELTAAIDNAWTRSQFAQGNVGVAMWDGRSPSGAKTSRRLVTYLAILGNILNNSLSQSMDEFDIIVATPAFLRMVCDAGRLRLENVKYFVVDEVARLSDPLSLRNFTDDVRAIVLRLPQTSKEHSLKAVIFSRAFNLNTSFLVQQIAAAFPVNQLALPMGCSSYIKISVHNRTYPLSILPKAPLVVLGERLHQYIMDIPKVFIAVGHSSHFEQLLLVTQSHDATQAFVVLADEPVDAADLVHQLQQAGKQAFLVLPDTLEQVSYVISQMYSGSGHGGVGMEPLMLVTFRARADGRMLPSDGGAPYANPMGLPMPSSPNYQTQWMVDLKGLAGHLTWHIVNFTCPKTVDDYYISLLTHVSPIVQPSLDQSLKLTFTGRHALHGCAPQTIFTLYGLEDTAKASVYQTLFPTLR